MLSISLICLGAICPIVAFTTPAAALAKAAEQSARPAPMQPEKDLSELHDTFWLLKQVAFIDFLSVLGVRDRKKGGPFLIDR